MMPQYSDDIPAQISQVVSQIEPQAEVILFGSRARGNARPDSDWDILILLDGEVTPDREQTLFDILYEVELNAEEVFSVLIYRKNYWYEILRDSPLFQNVSQEGIMLNH